MVTAKTLRLFDLYHLYKKGILLYAGGLMNQPKYYVEAMTIISKHL